MKVITWNVNSFQQRKAHIEILLKEEKPDFVLLQETKTEKIPENIFESHGYKLYHAGGKGRNGVALLTLQKPEKIFLGFEGFLEDPQAKERIIGAKIDSLYLFSIYVPNGSPVGSDYFYYKINFYYLIREYLEKFFTPEDKIILGGDFNVAPDPIDVFDPLLLEGHICFHERERKAFKNLLEWGLWDALRVKYPHKKGIYTWWDYQFSAFKKNLGMRLDHFLITESLKSRLKDIYVNLKIRSLPKTSDHAPLIAEFEN
ncbi:MAG: exodeoxyribonuclease III [Caldimicrobium sp.]